MGATPRYGFTYLDRGQSARDTRAIMQANAETLEAGLAGVQGYVAQLVSQLPGSEQLLGIDTDGTPYFDPEGVNLDPAGLGLDTDGTPYFVAWNQEGTLT